MPLGVTACPSAGSPSVVDLPPLAATSISDGRGAAAVASRLSVYRSYGLALAQPPLLDLRPAPGDGVGVVAGNWNSSSVVIVAAVLHRFTTGGVAFRCRAAAVSSVAVCHHRTHSCASMRAREEGEEGRRGMRVRRRRSDGQSWAQKQTLRDKETYTRRLRGWTRKLSQTVADWSTPR